MSELIQVKIDTSQMKDFARELARETSSLGGGNGHISQGLHTAAMDYTGAMRERFVEQSRGGGEWPPLAPSTIAGRRKGADSQGQSDADTSAAIFQAQGVPASEASILIDTATLLGSITPGTASVERISAGVRVGSNVEYAKYHQTGGGNLPQREIIVEPDAATMRRMQRSLERGYQKSVNARGAGT